MRYLPVPALEKLLPMNTAKFEVEKFSFKNQKVSA
jgi:hypothetical protein